MTFLQKVSETLSVILEPEASKLINEEILYSEFYAKACVIQIKT